MKTPEQAILAQVLGNRAGLHKLRGDAIIVALPEHLKVCRLHEGYALPAWLKVNFGSETFKCERCGTSILLNVTQRFAADVDDYVCRMLRQAKQVSRKHPRICTGKKD